MNRLFTALLLMTLLPLGLFASTEKELTIEGSKGKLSAILQLPAIKDEQKIPMVIICHGYTGFKEQPINKAIADNVVAQGMGALRFDFNGHGKSEGEFIDMSVTNEIEDLKKVIAWVKAQPYTENISLTGHSMGGMIVSQVASLLGNDIIHSLVLLAPGGVAKDNILMGNLYGQKIDPWNLPDYIENKRGMKVGKAYLESMRDQPIYENIQKYFGNTIVFNGSKDTVVIPPHGKRYADMMPNAEFELVEGDNHNFTVTTDATAQRVAQWLKSHQL